jgi:hypothetical protein
MLIVYEPNVCISIRIYSTVMTIRIIKLDFLYYLREATNKE